MSAPRLGRVQLGIMQVLWKRGRASARQITEDLNKKSAIAHSTVQTLLRKLEVKGAISHNVEDRTFVYQPLIKAEKVTRTATRELINRIFSGKASGLVAYLLKHENISKEELSDLRQLIQQSEE